MDISRLPVSPLRLATGVAAFGTACVLATDFVPRLLTLPVALGLMGWHCWLAYRAAAEAVKAAEIAEAAAARGSGSSGARAGVARGAPREEAGEVRVRVRAGR